MYNIKCLKRSDQPLQEISEILHDYVTLFLSENYQSSAANSLDKIWLHYIYPWNIMSVKKIDQDSREKNSKEIYCELFLWLIA